MPLRIPAPPFVMDAGKHSEFRYVPDVSPAGNVETACSTTGAICYLNRTWSCAVVCVRIPPW